MDHPEAKAQEAADNAAARARVDALLVERRGPRCGWRTMRGGQQCELEHNHEGLHRFVDSLSETAVLVECVTAKVTDV
jgi:uncharacterized protein YbbK (DUF523 family)